ncbi:hypothetical protein VitviT2T_030335 [Vitis vinifera]|uniref:Uncharacterized protein n=1 Tax=Vitis vinifera TaxID=29760 RepID=A0ABY9E0I3_VITVI|nr:hypothetical protein VitviT2T_030335 [Vitis vinifera]
MNEVTDSSGLYLRASNTLRDTSTTVLKEYCLRNSCANSLQVLHREESSEANQRCATPLSDRGNNIVICASSNLCPRITLLYNHKWIPGYPIPVYLSISGMRNSMGKAATGATIECGVVSVCPCKTNAPACGAV